jgi:hypothetical protein
MGLGHNELRAPVDLDFGPSLRWLALPRRVKHWSLTTLRKKLVKIVAKVVTHSWYVTFQMAEVAIPRRLFRTIFCRISRIGPVVPAPTQCRGDVRRKGNDAEPDGEVCHNPHELR